MIIAVLLREDVIAPLKCCLRNAFKSIKNNSPVQFPVSLQYVSG